MWNMLSLLSVGDYCKAMVSFHCSIQYLHFLLLTQCWWCCRLWDHVLAFFRYCLIATRNKKVLGLTLVYSNHWQLTELKRRMPSTVRLKVKINLFYKYSTSYCSEQSGPETPGKNNSLNSFILFKGDIHFYSV